MKKFIVISIYIGLAISIILAVIKSTPINDGWQSSSPNSVSMSARVLDDLKYSIRNHEFAAIDGIVIVKDGYLIFEEYENEFNSNKVHELQSVTKSLTALLIGIAIDQGHIENIDQPMLQYFDKATIENLDERKEAITLDDILTMRTGFKWNEWLPNPKFDPLQEMYNSSNWIKTILDTKMAYRPGIAFQYNSGSTILLDEIIKVSTGLDSVEFAQRNLFEPLGISQYFWSKENFYFFGTTNTGGGLYLRPRDLAKIGQLVLNKGNWNGTQVISERWIDEVLTPHVSRINIGIMNPQYGYLWYVFPKGSFNDTFTIYGCLGAGGQYLFVLPECNLVIVIMSENFEYQSQGLEIARRIVNDYVIKALE